MRLLLPTIVHGQAFRKITSMFYTVLCSWGLDSYQIPDSVRISTDTTFSAEELTPVVLDLKLEFKYYNLLVPFEWYLALKY
jgi:hypothetical protein